jgi:response regulator of citrate/malate metabolism
VVISADGSKETIAMVHAAGLDYLAKPVKPAACAPCSIAI